MNQRRLICLFFTASTLMILLALDPAFPVLAARGPMISTVAGGSGPGSYCGDGGPAISACLNFPIGVAVNGNNNLFIADTFNNRIRQFKSTGAISTVVGNGTSSFCGDH